MLFLSYIFDIKWKTAGTIIDYHSVIDVWGERKHQQSNTNLRLRNCGVNNDKFKGNANNDYVCESNNNNNPNNGNHYYFTDSENI